MELAGPGAFENERATDWLSRLEGTKDLEVFRTAFAMNPERAFFDKDTGSDIYAAGEVVAAAVGKPMADFPARAQAWMDKHPAVDLKSLKHTARALVEALLSPRSELKDLWEEKGEPFDAWVDRINDLAARLE